MAPILYNGFCSEEEEEISLLTSPQLKTRYNNIVKKHFSKSHLILRDNKIVNIFDTGKGDNVFILRGDILPNQRI